MLISRDIITNSSDTSPPEIDISHLGSESNKQHIKTSFTLRYIDHDGFKSPLYMIIIVFTPPDCLTGKIRTAYNIFITHYLRDLK